MLDSMEPLTDGYRIDMCWGELSEDQLRLVASFIQARAIKDADRALERARQTVALLYDDQGLIVGLGSVERIHIAQLINDFWSVAVYVDPAHVKRQLARRLNLVIRDYFEQRFTAGEDLDVIGMIMKVQSAILSKARTEAVTPNGGFLFFGRNRAGHDMRVYYFAGALLEDHADTLPVAYDSPPSEGSAHIELCWDNRTPALEEEVADFLQSEGALKDPAIAKERASHTAAIARDTSGKLIAEFSAQARRINQLDNKLWWVATYVSPDNRSANLSREILILVRDFLEQRFKEGKDRDVIGMFVVMQTRAYKGGRNRAVGPTNLAFVGRNKRGDNMRVYYFEGAHIDLSHIEGRVN